MAYTSMRRRGADLLLFWGLLGLGAPGAASAQLGVKKVAICIARPTRMSRFSARPWSRR